MKRKILIAIGAIAVSVLTLGLSLPTIVHGLGLHPTYRGEAYDLSGKRALVITTSHGVLNAPGETEGDPTGVAASELTPPSDCPPEPRTRLRRNSSKVSSNNAGTNAVRSLRRASVALVYRRAEGMPEAVSLRRALAKRPSTYPS